MAARGWPGWFDHWQLPEPIVNIPPAEAEETFHARRGGPDMVARNEAVPVHPSRFTEA